MLIRGVGTPLTILALVVHFQNSYLAEQYTREVFVLNLHCRETMYIAKGDPYCRFEVKPREAWLKTPLPSLQFA